MMSKPITYLAILLLYLAFLLYNYYPEAATEQAAQPESGRLLLWHSWTEAETVVLKEVLAKFKEIYPNIRVITAAIAPDDLLDRYQNTAAQGLGPDLLIGESAWIRELVDAELISDIAPLLSDTDAYFPNALESLRDAKPLDEDEAAPLYGLPLSLEPLALYYNTELVSTPATTLDELLEHAQGGQGVALNTTFDGAFWGIQAFGGAVFNEQGGLLLDQGGFANWLEWLKHAQNVPGMILSRDELTLHQLFSEREVAYYVAPPQALPILQEALGESAIGVAPLPAGVYGASGPLLRVEALMFNSASSKRQRDLSLLLASFLTNAEQSRTFMRDLGRVPANQGVRIQAEAYPLIDGFASQARTAVPIANWPQMALVRQFGDESYTQVLQGVTEPAQAASDLTAKVNEQYPDVAGVQSEEPCLHAGELRIWHSWRGESARALAQISQTFMQRCPEVTVILEYFSEDELLTALFNPPPVESHPMLIIAPSRRLFELAEAKLISPITSYIGVDVRQRFLPVATQALNYEQEVMGLPIALDFTVLYYKSEEVTAASTLDELLAQSTAGQEVALLTTFESAFWGISAFGGQLFDEQSRLLLEQGGLVEWLTWLEEAQKGGGVHLSEQKAALESSFVNNKKITTYIGPASALNDLQSRLGDSLGVALLPSAVSEAQPMVGVDAFFFPAFDNPPAEVALEFATYATGTYSQTLLMQQLQRLPATVNISTSDNPVFKLLLLPQKVVIPPLIPQMSAVWQQGDSIYNSLKVGEQTPTQIACLFSRTVNEINGFEEALASNCLLEINTTEGN